jgi:hypothetical protein
MVLLEAWNGCATNALSMVGRDGITEVTLSPPSPTTRTKLRKFCAVAVGCYGRTGL